MLSIAPPTHDFATVVSSQQTTTLLAPPQQQQKGCSSITSNNNNNQNKVETTVLGSTISTPTTRIIWLEQHNPLRCSVEESLADSLKAFITNIILGSFADQAELQGGDIIDGISRFFETITLTVGLVQV